MALLAGAAWLGERCARGARLPGAARAGAAALGLWSLAAAASGAAGPWSGFEIWPEADEHGPAELARHWRREWLRVSSARPSYDREGYDRAYQELLARCADDARAGRSSLAGAREALRAVAGELERLKHASDSRWAVHYQLGRVHEALGELDLARREYERTVYLYPRHGPAREAARRLANGETEH
jgi:hypothetical protein